MDCSVTLIDINLYTQPAFQCIICLDNDITVGNPLKNGNDIFITTCECKYLVHSNCINEWSKVKGANQVCINCNGDATLKNTKTKLLSYVNCNSSSELVLIVSGIVAVIIITSIYIY